MARGAVAAHAHGHASALVRRGIDLRLGFDLAASAQAALGRGLSAKVVASVGARGGLALQAAIPLDLFNEAGVVARFQAQAAAAASVSATLGLELDVFRDQVRELVPAPLDELLDVFLDEAEFSAGLWGRASFAAEILGEAVLAGTVSPAAPGGAGFSFSLQYTAGVGYGAGKEFVANIGFPDPQRLLDRLGARMTQVALDQAHVALPEPARAAMAALRILLPLGTRTAFRVGLELAGAGAQQRQDAATRGVVDAVAQQAQMLLLEAVSELASNRLAELLHPGSTVDDIVTDPQRLQQVRAELVALRDRLTELESFQPADAQAWLAGVLTALGPFGRLLDLGLVPAATVDEIRRALAILWSAAVLLERALLWYDHPARAATELFDTTPVLAPADGGFAAVVAEATGRPAGAGLRLSDLVAFLLGVDGLVDDLRTVLPGIAAGLDTIEDLLGAPAGLVLRHVLVDLAGADDEAAAALLAQLQARAGPLVQDQVIPNLIDPVKARFPDDKGLRLLLDELVTPTLAALPSVILPRLAEVGTDEGALRLREALSAVLLQSLATFTIAGVDVLLNHALTEGETALRKAAETVEQLGEAWGGLGTLLLIAAQAPLPVRVTPQEAAALLELASGVAGAVNRHAREPVLGALRELVRLGFGTAAGPAPSLQTLLTSDSAPDAAALERTLEAVRDGSWEVVKLVAPKALELVAWQHLGMAGAIAVAIDKAVGEAVRAVERGMALAGATVDQLAVRLRELAAQAAALTGRFAGQIRVIAERAQTLVEDVVKGVRAVGASLLEPLLGPLPDWAKDELRGLYNDLFDAARGLLAAPLALLGSVARFVEEACTGTAALTPGTVGQEVRRRILASAAVDLHFDLAVWADPLPVLGLDPPPYKLFDLGRVTIPAGRILTAIADAVLDDQALGQAINDAATAQVALRAVRAEEATVQRLEREAQAARAEAEQIAPGAPLEVRILQPPDEAVAHGSAEVRVRIQGANRTFVQPTLGVQPRVVVRVNGRPWRSEPRHWVERADGLELSVKLVPVPDRPTVPAEPEPAKQFPLLVERHTPVRARLERHGNRHGQDWLGFIVPVEKQARPARAPMRAPLPVRERVEHQPAAAVRATPTRIARAASALRAAAGGRAPVEHTVRTLGAARFTMRPAPVQPTIEALAIEADAEVAALGIDTGGAPVVGARPGMNVVQVAVADGKGEHSKGRVVLFLERDVPKVILAEVTADPLGLDRRGAAVTIRNDGPDDVDVEGWTLRDLAQRTFRFPAVTLRAHRATRLSHRLARVGRALGNLVRRQPLRAGRVLRVWTGVGEDDAENLHWGLQQPLWRGRGESLVLADAGGREIHRLDVTTLWRSP